MTALASPAALASADAIPSADDLVTRVQSYYKDAPVELLREAYAYARDKHAHQTRYSGEPYYGHTVAVAMLLADLRLDAATIMCGLLHDTVEDTDATLDEVGERFGEDVAELVDGVTKLGQMELTSKRTKQAENLQKLVVAITNDVRVLLVKLCDRLHNMRTLHFVPKPEKRERIARETLDIYAPLARRVGVNRVCVELEDLAFRNLNPNAYESIVRRLNELRNTRAEAVATVSRSLSERLEASGIEGRVFGREKRPYSIWRKLEKKGVSFDAIADIYAFRILVDDPSDCYRALGVEQGEDRAAANPHVETAIATGLGNARNVLVVLNGDGVVDAQDASRGQGQVQLTGAGGGGRGLRRPPVARVPGPADRPGSPGDAGVPPGKRQQADNFPDACRRSYPVWPGGDRCHAAYQAVPGETPPGGYYHQPDQRWHLYS